MSVGKHEVTVVVPTFNEEQAIGLVLDELVEVGYRNVLVVDGYSSDGTVRVAESRGVRVVQQNGHGKTGALKMALETLCSIWWLWLLRGSSCLPIGAWIRFAC